MKNSYTQNDVTVLLTDLTGKVEPMDVQSRERAIQGGAHYSELLPLEEPPSPSYFLRYTELLDLHGERMANCIVALAREINNRWAQAKRKEIVLVSLARAGTPVGVLLKRALKYYAGKDCKHYTISIIKGVGIDENALKEILLRHRLEDIVFVDGWVGSGRITETLQSYMDDFLSDLVAMWNGLQAGSRMVTNRANRILNHVIGGNRDSVAFNVEERLAVLADPCGVTELCGTREDIMLPSACMNGTLSGLFSRTIYREDLIGPKMFHGSVYLEHLEGCDMTQAFLTHMDLLVRQAVQRLRNQEKDGFCLDEFSVGEPLNTYGRNRFNEVFRRVEEFYGPIDRGKIKPSIGETTRVLTRRVPDLILLDYDTTQDEVAHILDMARERGIPCVTFDLKPYKACGLIKPVV